MKKSASILSLLLVLAVVLSACAPGNVTQTQHENHEWITVTTPATCQAGGFDTNTCSICGMVEICNETPIGTHVYRKTYSYDDEYHWFQCETCDSTKEKQAHTVDDAGICAVCDHLTRPTEGILYGWDDHLDYAWVVDCPKAATRVRIAEEYQGRPVTHIRERAFHKKNITTVIIPDSVTTIGPEAFLHCSKLTDVVIGNGVIVIESSAFAHCSSLTSVRIPNGVIWIMDGAFTNCTSLTNIEIPDSVTELGQAFSGCTSLTNVKLSNGLTVLYPYTFRDCTSLTSVVIPNSVTVINGKTFNYCTALTSVVIPDSVTMIGPDAFKGCSSLQYAEYAGGKYLGNPENPYLALIEISNKEAASYTIHNDTKIIASRMFYECASLTGIVIPDGVTAIGYEAFYNCTGLTSVTLGSGLITIDHSAFYGCTGLTKIVIPNGVSTIDGAAFANCSSLSSVEIPKSVTTISYSAFRFCESLTEIHYQGSKAQWQSIEKRENWIDKDCTIHCADGDLVEKP